MPGSSDPAGQSTTICGSESNKRVGAIELVAQAA